MEKRPLSVRSLFCASALLASFATSYVRASEVEKELALISARRVADLASAPDPSSFSNIDEWLGAQTNNGTWDDVLYLAGCPAQRANWPAQQHWDRLITFAAAWTGVNPSVDPRWAKSEALLAAIFRGLSYWFDNDYVPDDCMGNGGQKEGNCPCGIPGLWNTNWYDQAILIPQLCSSTCLLLKGTKLPPKLEAGCERIPRRAYDLRDGKYGTGGYMTGANAILVMQNSISLALYTNNATMLRDAFSRAMRGMTFSDQAMQDGIHRDGTFLQHKGVLYNGNYGKDLLNAFIQLEGEATDTSFAAGNATREAMASLIRGNEWMIYTDSETRQEHWDFNAIGRFVAFPTADLQASADINFNVSKLEVATRDFAGDNDLRDAVRRLGSNGTEKLVGNKGFWASDYMVHRRDRFTLYAKMLSNRSSNSESVNGANPHGHYLGQGTLFTLVRGEEYKDIMAAWDWNLVPGVTTLLNGPSRPPSAVKQIGRRNFVGVVSDGMYGTAVQDYVDPFDGSVSFRKAWHFFEDCVVVTISDIKKSPSSDELPVITVLDNRASSAGRIYVDSTPVDASSGISITGHTLYYGGNGYLSCDEPFSLTLFDGKRVGNWSEISTSKRGRVSTSIFSAYTTISGQDFSYLMFPASNLTNLASNQAKHGISPIRGDGITGVAGAGRLSLVFWPGSAPSITVSLAQIDWAESGYVIFTSHRNGVYMLASPDASPGGRGSKKFVVTLSDPTQQLKSTSFSVEFLEERESKADKRDEKGKIEVSVDLPDGGLSGSSVSKELLVDWTRFTRY